MAKVVSKKPKVTFGKKKTGKAVKHINKHKSSKPYRKQGR